MIPTDHLAKARTSRAFLSSVPVTNANADWAVVVLFYRALHLVRAYIHNAGGNHGTTHGATNSEVNRLLSGALSVSYLRLYSRSRVYRYDQLSATRAEFDRLDANDFTPLLKHVQTVLPSAV